MPDPGRRRFNAAERTALYLAADGRCENCGDELEPGWHGDHQHPYSAGGPTDVINGAALCPPCNLSKGSTVSGLRGWQEKALDEFLTSSGDFLTVATPGAGKTRFSLAAARSLFDLKKVNRLVAVVPTGHLRSQWGDAAHRHAGLQLDDDFRNGSGALASDFNGLAVTYSAVASQPLLYRKLVADRDTLVILDEVHHAGESKAWGDAMRTAFEPAKRRLMLSGTPFRSDTNPIPFVRYEKLGDKLRSVADYNYGYGKAMNDGAVRPVAFIALDGTMKWSDAGKVVSVGLSGSREGDDRTAAMRTALDPNGSWIPSVLDRANKELTRVRAEVPDAAGLVVAPDQQRARAYALLLQGITGEAPAIAISDEPDSSATISRFGQDTSRWIVAVQMVSEGVDIPRLAVGVYASNIRTEMFFRQVVGRFVRMRGDDDPVCAALFTPSIQPLLKFAAEISQERDHALADAAEEEAARRERKSNQQGLLGLDLVQPIASSEAIHHSTILSGDAFTDAELARGMELAQTIGGTAARMSPAEAARFVRMASLSVAAETPRPAASVISPRLVDEKKALKKRVSTEARRYAMNTEQDFAAVFAELNYICGDNTSTATVSTLEKRLGVLNDWWKRS